MALPAVLGALLRARAFVLVGDHYQLPPLAASDRAGDGGGGGGGGSTSHVGSLTESLFRRLCEAHPQATTMLRRQYRMPGPVQALANALVYCGALVAGHPSVAARTLPRPAWEVGGGGSAAAAPPMPPWLAAALDPARPVVVLSTELDAAPAPAPEAEADGHENNPPLLTCAEARAGDTAANPGEAALLGAVARGLLAAGVRADDAVAVSPYRAQVGLLGRAATAAGWGGVEALTVDQCQGRDRAAVLLSLVRSNARREPGRPLADWRRVNVAITRAREKLVVVGDPRTAGRVPLLAALLERAAAEGWVVRVPPGAAAGAGEWFKKP
jgi:DNA replication ATP-dependent helicase Dna2